MAKLEAVSAKRQGHKEKPVVKHYKLVLDEMRSQAKSSHQEPPRSQSFEVTTVVHDVALDLPSPIPRRRSEPMDMEHEEWPRSTNDTEAMARKFEEQPLEGIPKLQSEEPAVWEELPLQSVKPLESLNTAPGQCRSIITAMECKPNGFAALVTAGLMDAMASVVQYNLGAWGPLACSAQGNWYNDADVPISRKQQDPFEAPIMYNAGI